MYFAVYLRFKPEILQIKAEGPLCLISFCLKSTLGRLQRQQCDSEPAKWNSAIIDLTLECPVKKSHYDNNKKLHNKKKNKH